MWGSVVGDALGVPVEFLTREEISANPVSGMRGYGTHQQPAGTWSDDTSLMICTVESLLGSNTLNTRDMATRFRRWLLEGHWTPYGEVFDLGIATRQALARFCAGKPPERCGGREEFDNGNGSLMRVLPACLWFHTAHISTQLEAIHRVSSITHAHPRALIACGFFTLMVRALFAGKPPAEALQDAWQQAKSYYTVLEEFAGEWSHFARLDPATFAQIPQSEIRGSGYCVHTLEASIWCLLHGSSFEDTLLQAVNLGEDTDTTGSVTGALAGLHYGYAAIPPAWLELLARRYEIKSVFKVFATRLRC
ncbi:ADP-ribosylglycohydrolase family protein [Phragmitibacter flavus]|uniref:ADP-ribosylglycohydrolase family protein n=1 Tax=Phragmitibacter flavus TaxID=2576071 RepID=A0A5R8KG15_9BACT|nr:ADP-ribosylglycohydrolase family protein [Phragmitibacter flavus]